VVSAAFSVKVNVVSAAFSVKEQIIMLLVFRGTLTLTCFFSYSRSFYKAWIFFCSSKEDPD